MSDKVITSSFRKILIAMGLLAALLVPPAKAQSVIVVPSKSSVDSLSLHELRMIFKGYIISSEQRTPFQILEYDPACDFYYRTLYGVGPKAMGKHWLRLLFSGKRVLPPKNFPTVQKFREFMKTHDSTIGFLPQTVFDQINDNSIRAVVIEGQDYKSELYALKSSDAPKIHTAMTPTADSLTKSEK